jgi:hypothetical protein
MSSPQPKAGSAKKLPSDGINFHAAAPAPAPLLRVADMFVTQDRLIIMRALSAAADRWREYSRTEAFQSDDVDWAADASLAESIYRMFAK